MNSNGEHQRLGRLAVIGLGRVGLPLALSFADRGVDVLGVEKLSSVIDAVNQGRMPFDETGTQEVLERVLAAGRLETVSDVRAAAAADHIILTLGTPALSHIEIDVSQIRAVIDDLMPVFRPGHSLILRSTVAPGTTEWVAGYIEQRRGFTVGEDFFVSHVPERIAEGAFLDEIASLPAIVGGIGDGSYQRAAALFSVFGTEVIRTEPTQAELAKIWTNIYRYVTFAIPNLLMMECEQYGANAFEIIDLINHKYPRGGIAAPGLTAGTCLRKDFAFSEERSAAPGMLLAVSRVHETMPRFIVDGLTQRLDGSLRDRKIAVLGLSFKRDADDTRDSLSFKLIRLLERSLARVACHDPHVPDHSEPLDEVLDSASAVVIATNHAAFETLGPRLANGLLVCDPWDVLGRKALFSDGAEDRRDGEQHHSNLPRPSREAGESIPLSFAR